LFVICDLNIVILPTIQNAIELPKLRTEFLRRHNKDY